MISEYFSIDIDSRGQIAALPLLLQGYTPNMAKLPELLLRLAASVNWDEEKRCFDGISRELAKFYSVRFLLLPDDGGNIPTDIDRPEYVSLNGTTFSRFKKTVELIVLPAIRRCFVAPKTFPARSCMIELTDLPNLYRVFERC